ncbi:hypothetical protein tb265_09410 [Gemmatimonadetes bacterium T265]|nr:hypothetical protein tb265_09410 [Gemmatimonadetes bacterium T265]
MRRLRVGILDLVTNGPTRALYARVMNANMASIMPQVLAVWCERLGHDVRLVVYTGFEDLAAELPADMDVLMVGAFSETAQLAYAISAMYRARGTTTVLGGPHARCYPEDARRYFDYVLGFTDEALVAEVLAACAADRPAESRPRGRAPRPAAAAEAPPLGVHLSALRQPAGLPGVRERWPHIAATLRKAPALKIVPMLASLGCPYTCAFCIDSTVEHQPFGPEQMREDLQFLLTQMKRPRVAWHDPNFAVRFDETMDAIEAAVPPGRVDFIAESSLSLLSEARMPRLARNGFKALLPGVESWFALGNKSRTGKSEGIDKVRQVADHVNMVMRHVPYLQANFVLGLDTDEGDEPFELTKRFVDLAPGAFPGYSLLSAFGRAAPLNLELQRAGRVLPFPHHFLNNNLAMNVRPKNYAWAPFYDRVIDLVTYTFSKTAVARRFAANSRSRGGAIPSTMNVVRALSSEGTGRRRYYTAVRGLLDTDPVVRGYFEQEHTELPAFYRERVRRDLGPLWDELPAGALTHDPTAYLKAETARAAAGGEAPVLPTPRRRVQPAA